ncbi:MAG: DUF3656 domain-containing U32 family peptidase [Thermoanaerobacteraceae bacterium]
MKKVELLAPAGDFEVLKNAINAGADAVYLGGKNFGARAYASNFDEDALKKAAEFCHLRDVRIYVTVNTLVFNKEIKELINYLDFLYSIGIDAVIVQDVGVLKILHENYKDFKIHASTQMTVHNLEGVNELLDYGINRVVLSRELNLNEIKHITENSNAEIEVFVHGALCVSYSGQCLMSSLIGGRSGNRGRCAQPCRLEYSLVDIKRNQYKTFGQHLLSMADLCTIDNIPDLIEAGISSFKIEGRMKSSEYVVSVVSAYKNAIDSYYKNKKYNAKHDIIKMSAVFNRGFSTGYLYDKKPKNMSFVTPKNLGNKLGKVIFQKDNYTYIELYQQLNRGDGISDNKGEKGFKVDKIIKDGINTDKALEGEKVSLPINFLLNPGDIIYKTYDQEINNEIMNLNLKKTPIKIKSELKLGKAFYVKVKNGVFEAEAYSDAKVEYALNSPVTKDDLIKKLSQIKDTPFYAETINVEVDNNVFIAVKEIKKTRREAISLLEKKKLSYFQREKVDTKYLLPPIQKVTKRDFKLTFYSDKINNIKIAVDLGIEYIYFNYQLNINKLKEAFDYIKGTNTVLIPAFPVILRENFKKAEEQLEILKNMNFDRILISNLGLYHIAKKYGFELNIDYTFNIVNSEASKYFTSDVITLSPELNLEQIKDITLRSEKQFEAIVYGRIPLMITEYCPIKKISGCDKEHCKTGYYMLKDRKNRLLPLKSDGFCRLNILNPDVLLMIKHIDKLKEAGISFLRINDTIETENEIKLILNLYIKALKGDNIEIPDGNYTKGHYFRGVL